MKKCLGAFAVFFLLSILVTLHHETQADNATPDSANQGVCVSANNAPQAKQNSAHATNNRERWWNLGFRYFGWPEGIGAWALLATLGGILWQAKAAADAAKAAKEQGKIANKTLIAQFRPRVIVRHIELYNGGGLWGIHLLVENIGGTRGVIKGGKIEIRWRVGKVRTYQLLHTDQLLQSIDGLALDSGDEQSFNIPISNNGMFTSKINAFRLALREGRPDKYTMQAIGGIRYIDEEGAGKKTGFSRFLDIEALRFFVRGESEDEYQD